jgi:hypothetical protein
MTKARDISKLLSTANGKIAGANLDVSFENISDSGTAGTKIASGTTGQRGSTAGQIRFNTTTGLAEYYTGTDFKIIDSPPTVTAVSPLEVESDVGGNVTFTITGSNFQSGAVAKFVGNDATEITASTTTVTNSTTISAIIARSSFVNAKEPYDVKVINGSGLSGILDNQIAVDVSPTWSTASGTLATIIDNATGTHATVSATDADGDTVSYSETGGTVLTTAGLTLNSSTGAISGNPTDVGASTTYSFNLRASAGGINVDRAFSIIVTPTPNGTSRVLAVPVSNTENPITKFLSVRNESLGNATEGVFWFSTTNTANETYKFPTVIRNFNSNTWLMIGKNYRPHAYKNFNSDTNTSGGTSNNNNSAHSLSYGLIASNGSALVTNSNILSSASNAFGTSSTLGTFHAGVAIKSFGDNVWSEIAMHGRDGTTRYLSRNDLTTKIHLGQNPANGIYENNTWYAVSSGGGYMYFNNRMTASDIDTMRLGLTPNNSVTHDAYNNGQEHTGSTWFRDGDDDYLNSNNDDLLGGISNQGGGTPYTSTEWGRISIWVR